MGAGLESDQQYKADRRECEGNQLPDLPWRDRHDLRSLSTDPTMTKTTHLNHNSASVDLMQRPDAPCSVMVEGPIKRLSGGQSKAPRRHPTREKKAGRIFIGKVFPWKNIFLEKIFNWEEI